MCTLRNLLCLLAALLVLVSCTVFEEVIGETGGDRDFEDYWMQPGGGPGNENHSPFAGPAELGEDRVLDVTRVVDGAALDELRGRPRGAPVFAPDGTCYVASFGLFALDENYKVIWHYDDGGTCRAGPALSRDGTIYFISERPVAGTDDEEVLLVAVADSGDELWTFDCGYPAAPPKIARDGTLYCKSYDSDSESGSVLHAISEQGSLLWSREGGSREVDHAIAYVDGEAMICADSSLCYDSAGNPLSTYSDPGQSGLSILPGGSRVFGSTDKEDVFLTVVSSDGTELWSYHPPGDYRKGFSDTAIGSDGAIYFKCFNTFFYAMNSDGTVRWEVPLANNPAFTSGSVLVDGAGRVYYTIANGVVALSPQGEQLWFYSTDTGYLSSKLSISPRGEICFLRHGQLYVVAGKASTN